MKDFSIRQMRKEYGGLLRLCVGTAVVILLIGATLGALALARQTDFGQALVILGVSLALTAGCLSLYLILSDEKTLLKKTPFGRALSARGDARTVMREIDRAAQERWEPFDSFALLKDWLILFRPEGWYFEPYRVCAFPIPQQEIQMIQAFPAENPRDPDLRHIVLICGEKRFETDGYDQHLDALRQWMREQERPLP